MAHPDTAPARDEGCSVALRVGRAYTALGAWETIMGLVSRLRSTMKNWQATSRVGAGLTRSKAARAWTRRLSQAVLDTVEVNFEAWVAAT